MRRSPMACVAALALVLAIPTASHADMRDDVALALATATVVVAPDCTGVLAAGPDLVFTAAHCVHGLASTELTFADGTVRIGWVAAIDRVTDQAVMLLEEPVEITPLVLAPRRPITGQVLYFEGDARAPHFREIKLRRVARAPTLPLLQNALFTTIAGAPGDAGAPIVDTAARVVGLVHGGEIGTPVTGLRRLVDKLVQQGPLPALPHVP